MAKSFYTTTEASRLLAVSADTVLKWVRAGKIESYRTPGGHARIPRQAIDSLLPNVGSDSRSDSNHEHTEVIYKYCWDFYSDSGDIQDQCRNCVAFKSRAVRCYEMRGIPEEFGHMKLRCEDDCTDCEYFQLMQGRATSALVVSRNRSLINSLKSEVDSADIKLKFASSEYECAATIDKFRPDYIIVDCSFGISRTREICHHLSNDDRIPFTRIILTSKTASVKDCCDGEIFGWITKPFSAAQLQQLVDGSAEPNDL